ncbi:MAG: hypothetical protein ACO29A_03545 [Ilumatobacteraceae bacterium]
MKINRNNKYITAGLAAVAVAGLALGASGCFGGTNFDGANEPVGTEESTDVAIENDSAERIVDANSGISAPDDYVITADVTTADDATDDASDGSSITTESTRDDAASTDAGEPVSDTPATDTPATDTSDESETVTDPSVEAPTDDSAPEISTGSGSRPFGDVTAMPGAVVEMTLFVGDEGDVDASVFVKESGFGGNDIVSVKFVYYVGSTKVTTAATLGRTASATRSVWGATNMFLTTGTPVSIRVTDENGVTTYHDTTMTLAAMM